MNNLQTLRLTHLGTEPDGVMQFAHTTLFPPDDIVPGWVVIVDHAVVTHEIAWSEDFTRMADALDYTAQVERTCAAAERKGLAL